MSKVALLFPGQGVQYAGMGKYIYDSYSMVKEIFEEASDYCGLDIAKLCFEADKEVLSQTKNTQPAVLTVGYATAKIMMEEFGYKPDFAAGHSLGEFTALASAGGITFQDAVQFVKIRGQLMQEVTANGIGAMSAIVGIEPYMVKQTCEAITKEGYVVEVSNYNSPVQTVISGHKEAVSEVEERLSKLHAKAIRLNVSAPFHCSLLKPIVSQLGENLRNIQFHKLRFPVLSNVTGAPYMDEQKMKDMLVLQLTHPVEWTKTIKFLQSSGVASFIDVGPGETIKNLVKANAHGIKVLSFDKERVDLREMAVTLETKQNKTIKAPELEFIRRSMGIAISTENRIYDKNDYSNLVINPYRTIKELYNKLLQEGKSPRTEDLEYTLNTLCKILENKMVPISEWKQRVLRLLEETKTDVKLDCFFNE